MKISLRDEHHSRFFFHKMFIIRKKSNQIYFCSFVSKKLILYMWISFYLNWKFKTYQIEQFFQPFLIFDYHFLFVFIEFLKILQTNIIERRKKFDGLERFEISWKKPTLLCHFFLFLWAISPTNWQVTIGFHQELHILLNVDSSCSI